MESTIMWVANALSIGATIEQVHDSLAARGLEEHNIYLAIKAGEMFLKYRIDLYGDVD